MVFLRHRGERPVCCADATSLPSGDHHHYHNITISTTSTTSTTTSFILHLVVSPSHPHHLSISNRHCWSKIFRSIPSSKLGVIFQGSCTPLAFETKYKNIVQFRDDVDDCWCSWQWSEDGLWPIQYIRRTLNIAISPPPPKGSVTLPSFKNGHIVTSASHPKKGFQNIIICTFITIFCSPGDSWPDTLLWLEISNLHLPVQWGVIFKSNVEIDLVLCHITCCFNS